VIGLPLNDLRCLGSITEVITELVDNRDEVLVQLAGEHPSTEAVASWIRGLPQRDDEGSRGDAPKVADCSPRQRLRLPAPDPNCVERASLYMALAELLDPTPARQLATIDTPIGLHTFPVENGVPVILDPRIQRNALDCGVAVFSEGPIELTPREAIEWTTQLAELVAASTRNGTNRVRRGRNAMVRLVDSGVPPTDPEEIDAIAWLISLAERVAKRYGRRALAIVRSTAQAIADLVDEALARASRNFALEIGGKRIAPAPWVSALARIAGRVGVDVGTVALRSKLADIGVTAPMLDVLEEELNREGFTLGALARPSRFATFATLAGFDARRTA
jgi:hypothetical protein